MLGSATRRDERRRNSIAMIKNNIRWESEMLRIAKREKNERAIAHYSRQLEIHETHLRNTEANMGLGSHGMKQKKAAPKVSIQDL